jgi:hypothetical protein
MSWTVLVLGEHPRLDDLSWDPPTLGTGDEVRRRTSAHLPDIDWTDPTWGLYAGAEFTFESRIGPEEPVVCLAVHVRAGGGAIGDLLQFSVPNGWHLVDGSTCEVIDPASPTPESWQRWQAYRDKIRSASDGDGRA